MHIGTALGSPVIGDVCSAATVLIVIVWLVVAMANVRAVWQKKILWPGMDEDMEDIEGHPAEDGMGNRHKTQ